MPTGYTEDLYDGEQDFTAFVLHAARAFLPSMKESDEPIPEAFAPSPAYAEKADEARHALRRLRALTPEECQREAEADYQRWEASEQAYQAQTAVRRARLEAMRVQVLAWHPPTDDHVALRDFMVEQLDETIKFDCEPWQSFAPPRDGAVWRSQGIARERSDIEYYEQRVASDRQRAAEQTEWVRALRKSLSIPVETSNA